MIETVRCAACLLLILSGCVTTNTGAQNPVKPSNENVDRESRALPDSGANTGASIMDVAGNEAAATPNAIEGLTIEEALSLAETKRPDLEALRRRIGMAEGEAEQAGLWPNPTVSIGLEGYTPDGDGRSPDRTTLDNLATLSNRWRSRASMVQGILFPGIPGLVPTYELWVPGVPEPRDPDQLQQVVSIAQPLPIWGTPRLARKAGLLDKERWRHEYERARLELQSQVKKAFDEVVFQQERLATTLELEGTLLEILGVTRARLAAGDIAEIELIKVEADHERFSLEAESARTDLSRAKTRLARVLGDPNLNVQSCTAVASLTLPDLPDFVLSRLPANHPQSKAWEALKDAAMAQVAIAESRRWPAPTLGIGYRHYEFSDQDTFDISLEFELPLFDRKQGDIRAAQEKAKYAIASAESEKNDVEAMLQQTLAAFASHRRRAKAFQDRILPRMEESLSITRIRFEAGDTSMLDVLDAYRSLAEAKLAYHRELFETRVAYHELSYLLGGETWR